MFRVSYYFLQTCNRVVISRETVETIALTVQRMLRLFRQISQNKWEKLKQDLMPHSTSCYMWCFVIIWDKVYSVLISGKYGECHSCDASCKTCFGPQALDCSSCFKGTNIFFLQLWQYIEKFPVLIVHCVRVFLCYRIFPGPGQFLCSAVSIRLLCKLCHSLVWGMLAKLWIMHGQQ